MARVLILDPDPEARRLFELYFERLGHETVRPRDPAAGPNRPDLVVVEPAAPAALREMELLERRLGRLPVVCVSSDPPSAEGEGLRPVAYLRKPARSLLLDWAIADAAGSVEPAVAVAV